MADPHNVEFEAAKFLQKLIHESTDEPAKLATKLYVILQHMKASGKENSMPYQVISRAMETVINQHNLDIEALMSSRLPVSSGSHGGESNRAQSAGCSQSVGGAIDSKSGLMENDTTRTDGFGSGRPPVGPSSVGNDPFQGSVSQRSAMSFDHESPSSMETRSANSQDRRDLPVWEQQGVQKDPKRANIKRKRPESSGLEPEASGSFPVDSESWKQGHSKGPTSFRERGVSGIQVDSSRNLTSSSYLDSSGISHIPANTERLSQGGNSSSLCEMGISSSSGSRDPGKSHALPTSGSMPFKEHHLKQLRAQCLVFLAFRNGVPPKKLHLDVALGNMFPKEGAQTELIQDNKGQQQTVLPSNSISEVSLQHGNMGTVKGGADLVSKGPENVKSVVGFTGISGDPSHPEERENTEKANFSLQPDTLGMKSQTSHITEENLQPGLMGLTKQLKPEMSRWSRVNQSDISRGTLPVSFQHELGMGNESSSILSQSDNNSQNLHGQIPASWKSIHSMDSGHHRTRPVSDANMLLRNPLHDGNGVLENQTRSITEGSKVVPVSDSSYMFKDSNSLAPVDNRPEVEEGDLSNSANLLSSPKLMLSEKWIMAHQKKKIATEQKWVQKLQKADQRIATRFSELKETVSSSADISAKTRSVIELKKLQLLELQRCLRRNIMSDFFKPIQTEMDRLKSIKKHRIGRRLKHVEKYEQKMKEERQKRIRERQKEFFSEVEVHKERLEDVFKYKKERCKSFNRYVKEYHKRKERIHREKIDRIQREKINLLKINDVEGYLRMVQDAKSDRVNKLLKETEKYLQKLGSRLKEAKAAARQIDMDDRAIIDDSNDIFTETEDENDQAKHYKESNEKYYLIAHSIKENIAEQPTGLRGGKLREYQMNGLRWLVSLYNNHLNGILADEMGLGKTVQVISLICYLMETKNDRGPFLVVVPSSVLPGWEHELNFWAPDINKIVYAGPPEERRRLFKESIIHQKFNVLLTTYEYLMNKHDRPKLSKIHWHYIIIDEGHRIKNASCKLNADLKHYNSAHRLLLTGTPLQNNLEELWALLNFLLPNIFNSSEDFSQWFNKPFESNGDNSPDETLLSEEENLLIINRLHQVLRPFVLRRLKHKVENELPEKIERLIRCEASAYQKLLMKRVEENLGSLGVSKARAVHNSVMELRNICNHPYLSQLHAEEVDSYIPKHFLPPIVRLCGKLEMLDRLLPKLKETNHRVLFFSTMTRLLDVMEDYLVWKKYRYLRLDGHTSGLDRGALIDKFNQPDSPFFIFLLSIRAGGVGVNLQAADTVIIFDTDWNPQVDLQAQARAHRIGQKKDVLVLRLETVNTVEEQVRASAEHKLGVANQSITAGFFDNNTSAEDRREYLESLLRESKKEEAAPVLDDDSLNDILARSESEIDVFEAVDQKRREEEMATWKKLVSEKGGDCSDTVLSLPSRLVTDDDLKAFYEAMKVHDIPNDETASSSGMKRKGGVLGGFDTQQYGRGKRAREVRSYEEQWTEEEFDKICQAESPEIPKPKDEKISLAPESSKTALKVEPPLPTPQAPTPTLEVTPLVKKEVPPPPPVKRGRGRPRRVPIDVPTTIGVAKSGIQPQKGIGPSMVSSSGSHTIGTPVITKDSTRESIQVASPPIPPLPSVDPEVQCDPSSTSVDTQTKRQGRKGPPTEQNIDGNSVSEPVKRRGRKPSRVVSPVPSSSHAQDSKLGVKPHEQLSSDKTVSNTPPISSSNTISEGCARTSVEDSKESTLVTKETSSDTHNQVSTSFQDPKPDNQSTKPPVLDSSSVNRDDTISRDKGGTNPSNSGTELPKVISQYANPSSELALPSPVGLRPGTRQSQKPQSGIEPVRRRGRKRGRPSLTSLPSPDPQDKNVNEPDKNTSSLSTSTVTNVVTHSSPSNMGTGPSITTVHVFPVVQVSGFTGNLVQHVSKGSETTIPSSLQQSIPSGTLDTPPGIPKVPVSLPPQGQDQRVQPSETAPRRRGRKKNIASPSNNSVGQNLTSRQTTGDIVEHKVIATRSRQINISQTKNSLAETNTSDNSIALNAQNLVALQPSKLPSPSIEDGGPSKPPESRVANPSEDTTVCRIPSDIPPISCKGKTNVIVLALEISPLDVQPTGTSCSTVDPKEECSNPQRESVQDVLASPIQVCGLEVPLTVKSQTVTQEEELSAPPGFDTPRSGGVKKSFESDDCGTTPTISDARRGSVVLALESTSLTVDSSKACEKVLKEQKGSEFPPSVPIERKSVDKMSSLSEEMSAPPGFDLPQRSISQDLVVKSLEVVQGLASDTPSDIASKVKEDKLSEGLDHGNVDGTDTPRISNVGDSINVESSSMESKVEASQGSNDDYTEKDIRVSDSNVVAVLTSDSKEEDLLRGSADGTEERDAPNLGSDTPTISTCFSGEKEECLRPDDNDVEVEHDTDATQAPVIVTTTTLESKDELSCPGSDVKDMENSRAISLVISDTAVASASKSEEKENSDTLEEGNIPTASHSVDFDAKTVSTLEAKEEERCEPDVSNVAHEADDAPEVLSAVSSDTTVTPFLDSKKIEEILDLDNSNVESSTVNVFSNNAPSSLESKEKEECLVPDNINAENDTKSTAMDNLVSESIDSKEKGINEPENINAGNDTDMIPSSPLHFKEKEGCDEPNTVIAGDNSDSVVSNTVASSSFEVKEEKCHEPENAKAESSADSMVTDVLATASLDSENKQESQDLDNANERHEDSDIVVPDMVTYESFQTKAKEEIHEPDNVNAGNDADTTMPSTFDLKENEGCHEPDMVNAVDNAERMVSNTMASSTFEVNEKEERHKLERFNAENDADTMVTDTLASENLDDIDKQKCQELENAKGRNFDSKNVVSDIVVASQGVESELKEEINEHDNVNAGTDADTVPSSTLDSKDKEGCHEHDNTSDVNDADVVSNTEVHSNLEVEIKEECHEPENASAENDTDLMVADTLPSASLDTENEEKCQGLDNDNARNDDSENVVSDIVGPQIVESKEKEEIPEPNNSNVGNDVDVVPSSTLDLKEKEGCHDNDNLVSETLASSSFVVEEKEECHEPDNSNAVNVVENVVTDVASSSMELKEREVCEEPDNDSGDVATSPRPELQEKEESQVPVDNKDKSGASNTVPDSLAATSYLESKDDKEFHETDNSNAGNVVENVITDVASSSMELKEREECQEPDNDSARSSIVNMISDVATSSRPELQEKEESQVPVDDEDKIVASNTIPISLAASSDIPSTPSLESKEEKEYHGHSDVNVDDVPNNSCIMGSDSQTVLTEESKEKQECHGPENDAVEHVVLDVSPSCIVDSDNQAASKLESQEKQGCLNGSDTQTVLTEESKEQEEYPGPQEGTVELNAVENVVLDISPTSIVASDNQEAFNIESKEKEECLNESSTTTEPEGVDATINAVDSGMVSASSSELKGEGDEHDKEKNTDSDDVLEEPGLNDGNVEKDGGDAPTSSHVTTDNSGASTLE